MKLIKAACVVSVFTLLIVSVAYSDTSFVILGTQGGPVTAPERSQPANLLTVNGVQTLVDVGDGTAGQLSKMNLQAMDIDNILISHLHFDHMGGLQAIIGLRFQTYSPKPIQIYGPPGTDVLVKGIIDSMAPAMEADYGVPGQSAFNADQLVNTHVIRSGDVFKLGDTTVKTAKNTHYSFAPGSPEDKKFQSFSFRFETPDKVIVYTSDTGPSTEVEKFAKGADILISEMIDVELTIKLIRMKNRNMPEERLAGMRYHLSKHHLTTSELGKMAANAQAGELVVTHLAPGNAMTEKHLDAYTKKIAEEFQGKITLAKDMDKF